MTRVPLEGALSLRRLDGEAAGDVVNDYPVGGRLEVHGLELDNAYVELDAASVMITLVSADRSDFRLDRFYAPSLGDPAIPIDYAPED